MDGARILLAIEGRESLPVNIHDLTTGYEGVVEERRQGRTGKGKENLNGWRERRGKNVGTRR